jgi:hypothetical protein
MIQAAIIINHCNECPNLKSDRVYTPDSFEHIEKFMCKKKRDKKISGYVERGEKVEVPEWCPIRITSFQKKVAKQKGGKE